MKKMQKMFQTAAEENARNIRSMLLTELKDQKQLLVCQVLELEANENAGYNIENNEDFIETQEPKISWAITFREHRQQIIELWDVCYVSIIHRTQFYLLFRGDPADQIHMEVELRRLNWLQQHPEMQAQLMCREMTLFYTMLTYYASIIKCNLNDNP